MTQQEVALYPGVDAGYYRKYEAGEIDPSGTYLIAPAEYFGVTTD